MNSPRNVLSAILIVLPLGVGVGGVVGRFWAHRCWGMADARAGGSHEASPTEYAGHAHAHEAESAERGAGKVLLSEEAIRRFGVEVAVAGGGRLTRTLRLPGEIALNADRVAHIVPRVAGMVREVYKSVGDAVEAGELMAVLESRELAEARAADLAAEARLKLAEDNFKRIEGLLAKRIASEQEFNEARRNLEEAQIAHREIVARLHALGQDHDRISRASSEEPAEFARYEIRAPFAGTVVDKHITLGEVHDSSSDVFVLADLSTVWVDITLYPQDVGVIRPGTRVRVIAPAVSGAPVVAEGAIHYVSPIIRGNTRTGLARAAIRNEDGLWRPGLFVTAELITAEDEVGVLVPHEAIHTIENKPLVFVQENGGFEKRPVALGRRNGSACEIVSGLKPGERYVAKGGFILKSELSKGTTACCP